MGERLTEEQLRPLREAPIGHEAMLMGHIEALETENHVFKIDHDCLHGLIQNHKRQAEALKDEVTRLHAEIIRLKEEQEKSLDALETAGWEPTPSWPTVADQIYLMSMRIEEDSRQFEAFKKQLAERDEKIDEFKSASLLVTEAGDAADIEPHHVEAEITKLRAFVEKVAVMRLTHCPHCADLGYAFVPTGDGKAVKTRVCLKCDGIVAEAEELLKEKHEHSD